MYKKNLLQMVDPSETILFRAKPNRLCLIFEAIFNTGLVAALIWLAFDSVIISKVITNRLPLGTSTLFLFLFTIHLMPVWLYLLGIITVILKYSNIEYIITNKGVYISGGIISYKCELVYFSEITEVKTAVGFFDNILKVGDVKLKCKTRFLWKAGFKGIVIENIPNYYQVFQIVKKAQKNVLKEENMQQEI